MNHLIDGDSGDSCFSPNHRGCSRCMEDVAVEVIRFVSQEDQDDLEVEEVKEGVVEIRQGSYKKCNTITLEWDAIDELINQLQKLKA